MLTKAGKSKKRSFRIDWLAIDNEGFTHGALCRKFEAERDAALEDVRRQAASLVDMKLRAEKAEADSTWWKDLANTRFEQLASAQAAIDAARDVGTRSASGKVNQALRQALAEYDERYPR